MGPRLGRVEYDFPELIPLLFKKSFNGATLRTRGIPWIEDFITSSKQASMGPRLGRVEYLLAGCFVRSMGCASMGPRLGRVEYFGHE